MKLHKNIRRKSWSNMPPKFLACIGFLNEAVDRAASASAYVGLISAVQTLEQTHGRL